MSPRLLRYSTCCTSSSPHYSSLPTECRERTFFSPLLPPSVRIYLFFISQRATSSSDEEDPSSIPLSPVSNWFEDKFTFPLPSHLRKRASKAKAARLINKLLLLKTEIIKNRRSHCWYIYLKNTHAYIEASIRVSR